MEELQNEIANLKKQIEETTGKLSNASGELAEGRQKRQEIEAERDALKLRLAEVSERGGNNQVPNVEEAVKKILSEQEKITISQNKSTAEAKFKASHADFNGEADPGGVKFEAVKSKFNIFNTSSCKSVEDFSNFWNDAMRLAYNTKPIVRQGANLDANTGTHYGNPPESQADKLSQKERVVAQRLGWDDKKFLDMKAKRPHYIETLFNQI